MDAERDGETIHLTDHVWDSMDPRLSPIHRGRIVARSQRANQHFATGTSPLDEPP